MSDLDGNAPSQQRYHEEIGDAQWKLSLRSIPELKRASSRAELATLGLLNILDVDDRPTFAVDTSSNDACDGSLGLVYLNPALEAAPGVLAKITGKDSPGAIFADASEPYGAFRKWIWGKADATDLAKRGKAYLYGGHLWWATTTGHFKIVSGVPMGPLQHDSAHAGAYSSVGIVSRECREPRNFPQMVAERLPSVQIEPPLDTKLPWAPRPPTSYGPFDYTLDPPPARMSDHIRYFRSVDWEKTPLGSMDSWCPHLRCVVNTMMNDSYPAVLFWGDDVTIIYNEAYIQLISLMHPCMGESARVAAANYWPYFQPLIDHVNATGQTLSQHDMPIFLDRDGFLEETFFSFQLTAILDPDGYVAGYYQPLVETTKNMLLQRRVSSLVEIGSQTAKARDLQAYWELVLNTLVINDKDAPFALLYAAEHQSTPALSTVSSPGSMNELEHYTLKGAIGIDINHAIAPATINIKDGSNTFHTYLVRAMKTRKPIVVHFNELSVPDTFLEGIKWQGYGDPCRCIVVCPLLPTTSEQVQGFLLLGINPRRPFDEDYQQFVHVMLRLLATSLASVVLFDEEMRQKESAIGQAAEIQEQLLAQLQMKEKKFQRYAANSDVAIFVMDPVGNYTYRNKSWFEIFETAVDESDVMSAWANIVWPEDIPVCEALFAKLVVEKTRIFFELKTSMLWKAPIDAPKLEDDSQQHYKWILCSAYPELNTNNEIVEIVGNVTDISKQKWAEGMQRSRTDSAEQSKRHLEHFIDTTSHEMRNPLSAIMQCADGILTSYPGNSGEGNFPVPSPTSYVTLLEQTVDAAHTIAECAQHMKRIVDDILTISKLDSGLLVITPIDSQPESIVGHAVKMFEGEAQAAGVDMNFSVEQSFRDLNVEWVSLDPTRLLQVLINLITNALKFTRLESVRHISVKMGASEVEPTSIAEGFQFEPRLASDDVHLAEDWKGGPLLYVHFSVADTGRGLSEDERRTLFARFSQASPRTHIHYGGSGLGLFISRRLTEMQGGAIGLASKYKEGSTFAFYIKARRAAAIGPRRPSLQNIFPEEMRHRATARKEIDRMTSTPQSPTSSIERRGEKAAQGRSTDSPRSGSSPVYLKSPRPPMKLRQQSAIHPDVPAEAVGLPPDPDLEDLRELKRTSSIPEPLHVLIVEDNLVNQKVLAKQLRNLGCVVNVANHGVEALDFLKKTNHWNREHPSIHLLTKEPSQHIPATEPPPSCASDDELPIDLNVILMDWEMPVMNGLTAVAKIRELETGGVLREHIPVIGVTANVREQQIQTAMDAGMDDVISKPFRVAELMGRMRNVVEGIPMSVKDGED